MATDLGSKNVSEALHSRPEALFIPRSPQLTRTFRLLERVNQQYGSSLVSYSDLFEWSTGDALDKFWSIVWDETDILGVKGDHIVDTSAKPDANPAWFPDAQLNWAENMLRCRSSDRCALIEASAPRSMVAALDRSLPLASSFQLSRRPKYHSPN
jgi:acetoacetyl-CoA synthetase